MRVDINANPQLVVCLQRAESAVGKVCPPVPSFVSTDSDASQCPPQATVERWAQVDGQRQADNDKIRLKVIKNK